MSTKNICFHGKIRKIFIWVIGLDKMLLISPKVLIFFIFLHDSYVVVLIRSALVRHFDEYPQHMFYGEIRKLCIWINLLSKAVV